MKQLRDHLARLSDIDLSSLLGISKPEYENLIHSPLYHYKNDKGDITEFFMHVSPLNNEKLLKKIRKNNYNMAVFNPSEIFELNRQQFLVSNHHPETEDYANLNFVMAEGNGI